MKEQQTEPKFVQPYNGTIAGTTIGIAAAMAAQKIYEADKIRDKNKQIKRNAEIIAECLMNTKLPETQAAIDKYMNDCVADEMSKDKTFCEIMSNLYIDEARAVEAKRLQAVNKIIEEDPHGVTPLCTVFAKGDQFIETLKDWEVQDNRHRVENAKKLIENDYDKMCKEAKTALIEKGIIDNNGELTEQYCADVKAKYEAEKEQARQLDMIDEDEVIEEDEFVEEYDNDFFEPNDNLEEIEVDEEDVFIDGFAGIGTGDPYEDEYKEIYEDDEEEYVDDVDDDTILDNVEEPSAEMLDETAIMEPVHNDVPCLSDEDAAAITNLIPELKDEEEKKKEKTSPAITADLGEVSSVIAEMVEEDETDKIDDELIMEAIQETAEEVDEEIKEALSNVDELPEAEEIKDLIVDAIAAEKDIETVDEAALEDITIVDVESDEVNEPEPDLDKNEAIMFTQSFMAVNPKGENGDDAADEEPADEKA